MLFMSRTMAHKAHLKTGSYAQHVALGGFYECIVGFADSFAEAAQGKYGLLDIPEMEEKGSIENPTALLTMHLKMFQNLSKGVEDRFLQNIVDEIEALYYSTIYKLSRLS